MLSRVANSIYWMSRNIERAENYARFIQVNLNLSLDLPEETVEQWEPLVMTTGDQDLFKAQYNDVTRDHVIYFLVGDPKNPNSILSCLNAARENARSVREIISSEMWEQVNRFYLTVKESVSRGLVMQNPHMFFTGVKEGSHLFVGITDATLSHGEGWHFNRLGRLIERADKTSRILDVKYYFLLPSARDVGTSLDNIQWAALLKSASALEMYRKRYGPISPHQVAEFLILDPEFPRAVRFSLIKAADSLRAVSGSEQGLSQNLAEKRLGRLQAELAYADIDEIMSHGLHEFLDTFQAKLNLVGDAIAETFFTLRPLGTSPLQEQEQ
ncbi:MAG TPA: alpha-E domain-containing protein [Nitrospira sp.]|nr:alpha-E domain-containing protein [Nitrospira sp.]